MTHILESELDLTMKLLYPNTVLFRDIIDALEKAAEHKNVRALIVRMDQMCDIGMGQLQVQ